MAKAETFVSLTNELAQLVAEKGDAAAARRADAIDELKTTLKENISVGQVVRFELGDGLGGGHLPPHAVGSGRERRAGGDARRHARSWPTTWPSTSPSPARPTCGARTSPQDEVAAERATVETISRNEGKPEAALPKIVEGRMNGWFKERCLLEQPYAKDEKRTIADLIGSAEIVRFAQVVVGG